MKRGSSLKISVTASMLLLSQCVSYASDVKKSDSNTTTLKQITISASRTEQDVNEVPASISVIDSEKIEKEMVTDIKDLFRYEPDVSVRFQPNRASAAYYNTGRGGNEGINIRGLEGNQVLMQTDGMRIPQAYSSGPFSSGRGDYVDMEAYKTVEILRGAASTMYGSDGLAGAVSFATKDPSDLLTLGNPQQSSFKFAYSSADKSFSFVPSYAARFGKIETLILGSFKEGHETDTKGGNDSKSNLRTSNNPQETKSGYLLGKVLYRADNINSYKLSVESLRRSVDTDVYTLYGDSLYLTTTNVDAKENIRRDAFRVDYEYKDLKNPLIQKAKIGAYYQESENKQYGFEARSNTTGWNTRWRENTYSENTYGLQAQGESNFGSIVENRIIYGIDLSRSEISVFNGGANLLNGVKVTAGSNSFAPKKNFPDTDYDLVGVYLQDEISIGKLALIPGVRYDSFKLDPKADALYRINNTEPVTSLSDSAISPKFGLMWKQNELANMYAQYSRGFRAPTASNVNGGTTNLTSNYKAIGNPNLEPETSDSYEFGIKGADKTLRYAASAFHSKYKNFIASGVKVGGSGTAGDPTIYQSINYSDVDISGYELKGEWSFIQDWSAGGAYAKTWGHKKIDGNKSPLETIEPAKIIVNLKYDNKKLSSQLSITHAESKSNPESTYYSPEAYELVDLTASYQLSKNTVVNVGLFNIFDKKYFLWSDVRDLSKTSKTVDAYSQPGRNFSASLKYQF